MAENRGLEASAASTRPPRAARPAQTVAGHAAGADADAGGVRALSPLALLAGMSGNLMEWYDFALYGVLAGTLGELFFPRAGRLLALLSVFGVFAAGYVMRLAGGAAFGHLADGLGRRRALLLSAAVMAVATSLVGCLPTYATVGAAAPVLFTVFRLLQGLSVGGEFTTSISYLMEHAPPGRRALQASFASATAGAGILLGSAAGNGLFAVFTTDEIQQWAWRIPFLLSVPLGVSLAVLRSTLPEDGPPPGEASPPRAHGGSPVWRVFREHPGEIVRGALMGWGPNAAFYTIAVFLGSFLSTEHLLTQRTALGLQTAAIGLMVALTPVAGHLADRIGRKPMVLFGTIATVALVWPMFAILQDGDPTNDLFAELVFSVVIVAALSPYQAWLAESFPRALRASGLGVAYNGAAGILGGTTPLACATLVELTGSRLAPSAWVAVAALVSAAMAARTEETGFKPLS
ncbi:MAG TPA: MFS transporter [Candidatus Binatia bacterium]|nr:MFS transporter [Candidatus Binatia bacterium]